MRSLGFIAISALLGACGDGDPTPAEAGAGDLGAPDLGMPDGGMLPEGPGLAGILVDETEQPIARAMVLACQATTCLFGQSGDDGRFSFDVEPPAEIALKTLENLTRTPRWGAALVPIVISDDRLIDVGPLYVPNLPEGTRIGPATMDPQTLDAGDGLVLTLHRADLMAHLGDVLSDVAARKIPAARVPPIPELGAEQVVALYAMHPFAAKSRSKIAIRAASDLPAGTAVYFRTISELDGKLSARATGTADGTNVVTHAGEGIEELTYLVISR